MIKRNCTILFLCLLSVQSCTAQEESDTAQPTAADTSLGIELPVVSIDSVLNALCVQHTELDRLVDRINRDSTKWFRSRPDSKDTSVVKLDSTVKLDSAVFHSLDGNRTRRSKLLKECKETSRTFNSNHHLLGGGYNLSFKGVKYQIYVCNDSTETIRLHHKSKTDSSRFGSIGKLKRRIERDSLMAMMITNAGMYTPSNDPEGLYIEEYKELFELDTGSSEVFLNFYMHPNGVYFIDSAGNEVICSTKEYSFLCEDSTFRPRIATQSGPMLKIHGKIHHKFNRGSKSKKIRSGVGIFNGKSVFAITRGNSNFYDFATFFTVVFNCENALFLDGAISRMYMKGISEKDLGGNFGPLLSVTKKTMLRE